VDTDKDAIVETVKTDKVYDKDVNDDLATMMSGLGIEAKCSICFTMYPTTKLSKHSIPTNRERCEPCELNLTTFQKEKRKTGQTSSSKIRRVLEILKTTVDGIQVKTIIFSQFTSMLDLLEPFLHDNNIKHGRCTPCNN
jgi:SNF2 family DNA or RNA helicase